jgi:hydrogenase maturation protease
MRSQSQERILIGGVGYHWCGDGSWGLQAVETLSQQEWPSGVEFGQLDYGAIYVSQELAAAKPPYSAIVFLSAVERDREPGRVYGYSWQPRILEIEELQSRIREAGAGVIDLEHLLAIAQHFGALPKDTRIIEFEPADLSTGTELSPAGKAAIAAASALLREFIPNALEGSGTWEAGSVGRARGN